MREILFRGKRRNGTWIDGNLLHYPDVNRAYIHIGDYFKGGAVEVDCATIGQYTGLKDKNGKRIFEGDIVVLHGGFLPHWYHEGQHVVVEYDGSGFIPLCEYDSDCGDLVISEECEIIGNVHDNPELIGG